MTFDEWIESDDGTATMVNLMSQGGASVGVAKGVLRVSWNAALEAAARNQHSMLRDMISRGHAADQCRALKA